MSSSPCVLCVVLMGLGGRSFEAAATPQRFSRSERFPAWRNEPPRPGVKPAVSARKERIFGIGVGFEKSGTLAGVAVNIVLPGSPAARAGLVPGCVIAEVNGETTVGRMGDDCARLIREAAGTVRLKLLDPALKERILTLKKEWIAIPD